MSASSHPGAIDVNGLPYLRDAKGSLVPLSAVKPADLLMDETVRSILEDARAVSKLIAAIKSEAARRRATKEMERQQRAALRSTRKTFEPGTEVEVSEMPALAGVAGVVETSDGAHAWVRFGSHSWKIEGWRLSLSDSVTSAVSRLAA